MGRTALLLLLLPLAVLSDPINLVDGETVRGEIKTEAGGVLLYKFHTGHFERKDLIVSLTPYSDLSDPEVYMAKHQDVSQNSYEFPKETTSRGFTLSDSEFAENTDYYILVTCELYCHFALTVAHLRPIDLKQGAAINGDLAKGHEAVYSVLVEPGGTDEVVISVTPTSMKMNLKAELFLGNDTAGNPVECSPAWHAGIVCLVDKPDQAEYRVVVTANTTASYSIVLVTQMMTQSLSAVELRVGVPEEGKVAQGSLKIFKFKFDRPEDTIILTLTAMSGDPDLYVKVDSAPTRQVYDFLSISQGADTLIITKGDRNEKGKATGDYFVGVFGSKQASFTLTLAYNTGTFVPLTPGVQQTGYVDGKDISLYYMDVPTHEDLNVTVTLLPNSGKPKFYVKLCTSPLKKCRIKAEDFSSPDVHTSKSGDTVRVEHPQDTCKGANCRYAIAVVSSKETSASYRVYASYNDYTPHVLRQGKPSQMAMPAGDLRYFRYQVLNLTVLSLTIQVTPVTGDPDLYATRNGSLANYEDFEKRSTLSLTTPDAVTFSRESDGPSLVGMYYVTVSSPFTYSFFTILATEQVESYNTTVHLRAGHPQMDTLSRLGHFRIFSFATQYTNSTQKPIKLTITPMAGAFDLYVDNTEASLDKETMVFSYAWSLRDIKVPNRQYDLVIDTSDLNYKQQAVYLVIVVARNFDKNETASYMLLYRSGHNPVRLQEDVAVRDDVDAKDNRLYSFTLLEKHEDVTIIVTALSGDPDLYVSFHPENPQPDQNNFDVCSTGFAGEVLTLLWEQLETTCSQLPCSIYVAVIGYSASVYDIKVLAHKDMPENLPLDTPQRGAMNKTEYRYYYSTVSTENDLQVLLQSLQGDADLFINLLESNRASMNLAQWVRPNLTQYLNTSQQAGVYDRIHLTSEVLKSVCKQSCIVLTGVYCASESCQYILYHEKDGIQLIEGVPARGMAAANKFAYFRFYCDRKDAEIVVTVTPVNDATPKVYVSRGSDARPDAKNYNWKLTNWHGKPLVLHQNDIQAEGKSMRDHFAVGVTSALQLSFTISVSFNQRPELLISGAPASGTTAANSTSLFCFFSGLKSDISIRVTPTTGFVVMYAVSYMQEENDVPMPTKEKHTWTSTQTGNIHELYISTSDPRFCVQCYIYIAVVALERNSTYRITAMNVQHMSQLSNGIPTQGSVRRGEIVRYVFEMLESKSFDISLVTLSGNADLFVGLISNVSSHEYVWSSSTDRHVDHIRIPKSDHRFQLGSYYIGVVGAKESAYSITSHVQGSFIHLVSGWPQFYSMHTKETDNFFFDLKVAAGEKIACVLRAVTSNFKPRVFLIFEGEDSQETLWPSSTNSDVEFKDFKFNELRFANQSGLAGKYNIGVYNPVESKEDVATFQLMCASESELNVLKQTDTAFASVDTAVPVRRYMVSTEETGTLTVTLVMCSGKVSLQVSRNYNETSSSLIPVVSTIEGLKAIVTNSTGAYYLTVSLLEVSAFFDGAGFEISTSFQTEETKPRPALKAGEDGFIEWTSLGFGRINLRWEPPTFSNGTDVAGVRYRVFLTESRSVTMSTVCGMRTGEMNLLVQENSNMKPELQMISLDISVDTFVTINVIAEVQLLDGIEYVPYSSIEVFLSAGRGGSFSPNIIGLIVATAAVLLTLLLVYMYRYRKAQRRLEYELSDVRNVASITSEIPDPEALRKARRDVVYSPLQLESSDA